MVLKDNTGVVIIWNFDNKIGKGGVSGFTWNPIVTQKGSWSRNLNSA